MPETVGQRISQLIASLGISKNAFALSLDKTATVVQHLVDERNKPGFDLLCKIFEVYPKVSKDWLLQGNGQMLLPEPASVGQPLPLVDEVASPAAPAAKPAAMPASGELASAPAPQPVAPTRRRAPAIARFVPKAGPAAAGPEVPVAAPVTPSVTDPVTASVPPAVPVPELPSAPVTPVSESAALPAPAPPAAGLTEASLQAALYAQQMGHQLALAELRNQHLLDQQRMMQQMMELMQRQLSQ